MTPPKQKPAELYVALEPDYRAAALWGNWVPKNNFGEFIDQQVKQAQKAGYAPDR